MSLQSDIKSCKKCPLYKDMPEGCSPVPGIGPRDAEVMFVGEALGEDESYQELPFVGMCGKFLDKMLETANIDRSKIFVSNTVKCRPTKNNGKSNRPPSENEINTCKLWLWKEIQEVKPSMIITLGKVPTYTLLNKYLKKSFTLSHIVGQEHEVDYNGFQTVVVPQYHPSYLMVHGKNMVSKALTIFQKVADEKKSINRA